LQLARRIEAAAELAVEALRRPDRQGLAEQDVGVREPHRVVIEKGLMKGHQSPAAGASHHVIDQPGRRQRLLDDAVSASAAPGHRGDHEVDVVIQAVEVDQQAGPHRAVLLQFLVQRGEIRIVRRTFVARAQQHSRRERARPQAQAAEQQAPALHVGTRSLRRCSLSIRPSGSRRARTRW
jgi:hypothetical protein